MAAVESDAGILTISIVYDGAPRAGKTTSIRALARSFGGEVFTPEEREGRTVYFDWFEHTGGRFDGAPFRCQIVSVPGQEEWSARRRHFVDAADAVVFVGHSGASNFSETRQRLQELRAQLEARGEPRVGIIFQANQRDAVDALPLGEVRRALNDDGLAVVETVASEGSGVREAFVFAVRIALDRVRALQQSASLPARSPARAADHLEHLLALERSEPLAPEHSGDASPAALPRAPRDDVPSGLVWPPVEGRVVLHEALGTEPHPEVTAEGDYVADLASGFRIHSGAGARFGDREEGLSELLDWARLHSDAQPVLSRRRCVVLAPDGSRHWRLWQVVRKVPSLRQAFLMGRDSDPKSTADRLLCVARLLLATRQALESLDLTLPCTLDSIGATQDGQPLYIGLVPRLVFPRRGMEGTRAVAAEVASLLRGALAPEREAVCQALCASHPDLESPRLRDNLIESLRA